MSIALATERATPGQKRVALILAVVALLVFLVAVPFVRVPLLKMPAFIPAYQTALFFIDLITAALLLDQFLRLRSLSLLALASGYLFDALIIIPHTLSFPGAFTPGGLMGSGPQTTAWLYVFWHGGFPLFVMGYALLRRRESSPGWGMFHVGWMVGVAIASVVSLAIAFTLVATWGHDLLPVVMQGSDYSMLVSKGISPAVWLLTVIALIMLWRREIRVMELWLMLVMWVWLLDIAMAAVLGSKRFDLGFYAGRMFGLIAASVLVVALFVEMARMYSAALAAVSKSARQQKDPPPEPAPATMATKPAASFARQAASTMDTDMFIRSQNIVRYRRLLDSGALSPSERTTITELLRKEEARAAT